MTNAMLYSDEILSNIREVLWNIKERGGLVPTSFLDRECKRLAGQYNTIVMNVALMAIGKGQCYESELSESQLNSLVERARKLNGDLLHEISQLRAEKGKK